MVATMRKAWMAAALPLVYAVVNMLLAGGSGPSDADIAAVSTTTADIVKTIVEMGIGGFLVWLVPNRPA